MLARIAVAQQRKWRGFSGTVARRAVLKENGGDVFGEGHCLSSNRRAEKEDSEKSHRGFSIVAVTTFAAA
jgi:hypothetical protein